MTRSENADGLPAGQESATDSFDLTDEDQEAILEPESEARPVS